METIVYAVPKLLRRKNVSKWMLIGKKNIYSVVINVVTPRGRDWTACVVELKSPKKICIMRAERTTMGNMSIVVSNADLQ